MRDPGFFDGEYRDLDGYDPPTVDEDFEALGGKVAPPDEGQTTPVVLGDAVAGRGVDNIADKAEDDTA